MLKAKVVLDSSYVVSDIDGRLYGSFLEHLGNAVYGGVYEPGHPASNESGYRTDVLELVRELDVPIVRYPGGNFVSAYNWEDGVGPKDSRPKRFDPAWNCVETNGFGTNEFCDWAAKAGVDVMMAVNLGSLGPNEAAGLVEYCNYGRGTYYSDLRRSHGYENPRGVKTWCLGNEMDGDWQVGCKTPDEYARVAYETAKRMKWVDGTIELVACGSSGPGMPTFPNWEATVLERCYDEVDYISEHIYLDIIDGDQPSFLASAADMERFIKATVAACDYVKAKRRKTKDIHISFDEWNVWFQKRRREGIDPYYTLEDALVVGTMLNVLIRNADRVKIGCQAQLVNVIAPITAEAGGPAWRQTIFHPYRYASAYGRGRSLMPVVDSPAYDCRDCAGVPYLDIAASEGGDGSISIFAVNRSLEDGIAVEFDLRAFPAFAAVEHTELYDDDVKRCNTRDAQPITPKKTAGAKLDGGRLELHMKKHSWGCVRLSK